VDHFLEQTNIFEKYQYFCEIILAVVMVNQSASGK